LTINFRKSVDSKLPSKALTEKHQQAFILHGEGQLGYCKTNQGLTIKRVQWETILHSVDETKSAKLVENELSFEKTAAKYNLFENVISKSENSASEEQFNFLLSHRLKCLSQDSVDLYWYDLPGQYWILKYYLTNQYLIF
jgi:hypothetical protein